MVSTEDGLIPISEVTPTTKVLAFKEETGEVGYYPVLAVWGHEDSIIIELVINDELIETTPEHPFYTADGKWVPARQLAIGDRIQTADGPWGIVESIVIINNLQIMYNFTVGTAHTYFVGQGQWLVHNRCRLTPRQRRDAINSLYEGRDVIVPTSVACS